MRKKAILFVIFIVAALTIFIGRPSVLISEPTQNAPVEETTREVRLETPTTPEIIVPQKLMFQADYEWNSLAASTVLRGYELDVNTGCMRKREGSSIVPFIAVMDGKKGVFYAPGKKGSIFFYDTNGCYMCGSELLSEEEVFVEYPKGCKYVSVSMEDKMFEKAIFVNVTEQTLIVTKKEASSINEAVQKVSGSGVILVFPGTYQENVKAYGKQVEIYGVDRESCVLESNSSDYYNPPLEIAGGVVADMTIRAVDNNSPASRLYAYGVHIEDHFLCDNALLFKNCNIYSDFNSAVGMGLRGGCAVTFENCVLKGKENGLFCHDCPYQKYTGLQRLVMKNCIVAGMQKGNAIRIDSQGVTGADVELLFCNNLFQNADGTTDKLLYVRNNNGMGTEENFMGLKNFRLLDESRGNNIDELNSQNPQSLQ